MTIQFPVYTFHFLYSSCGCSSKGLPASEELPVSVSTTLKVTLQPTDKCQMNHIIQNSFHGRQIMYVCSIALKKNTHSAKCASSARLTFCAKSTQSEKCKGKKANCKKKEKEKTNANCTNHIARNRFQNATCTKQLYKAKIEKCFMY